MYNAGIHEVVDLLKGNKIMTYEDIQQIHGSEIKRLDYYSLIHAILTQWKQMLKQQGMESFSHKYEIVTEQRKSAKIRLLDFKFQLSTIKNEKDKRNSRS